MVVLAVEHVRDPDVFVAVGVVVAVAAGPGGERLVRALHEGGGVGGVGAGLVGGVWGGGGGCEEGEEEGEKGEGGVHGEGGCIGFLFGDMNVDLG